MLRLNRCWLHRRALIVFLLLVLFLVPGCATKPFLTPNNIYNIIIISAGIRDVQQVTLPWNANKAVMQNLLLESSFALSDLHTPKEIDIPADDETAVFLQAIFPQSKHITFSVDNHPVELDVRSVEIEVEGAHIGRVIINDGPPLQGIPNPNLPPAFEAFRQMLEQPNNLDHPLINIGKRLGTE